MHINTSINKIKKSRGRPKKAKVVNSSFAFGGQPTDKLFSSHNNMKEIEVKTQSYWTSPHTRAKYPAQWVLSVPSVQLSVHIMPVLADQELRTSQSTQVDYWEGAVDVNGRYQGNPVQGVGYVELTGYSKSLSMDGK